MTNKTKTAVPAFDLDTLPTKSAKIRYLANEGMSRGDIARTLKIRYQHVRNVLITPVTNPKT